MRYLIIGGTGIFGEGLIKRLLDKKDTEKVVATNLPDEDILSGDDKLSWKELDLRDEHTTNEIVKDAKADVIFDLATQDSVGLSWVSPTETVNINIVGTINLLNAVRDYSKYSRIVIGGSGEEYGKIKFSCLPITEGTTLKPDNIYGATKACQTMFAKLYHQAYGMDIVVLRTFYETGIKQDDNFAVSSFCKQFALIEAGKEEPTLHVGNINNIRDFTDIEDLIRAFDVVAERGKPGEVYNAGRGEYTSLLNIIRILENLTGIDVEIKMDSNRMRPMDAPVTIANVEKIYKDCGWRAEISMVDTLKKMLNSWRAYIVSNVT